MNLRNSSVFALILMMTIIVSSLPWNGSFNVSGEKLDDGSDIFEGHYSYDTKTVQTEWVLGDGSEDSQSYMHKVRSNLREKMEYLGSQQVKVTVFAEDIEFLYQAMKEGFLSLDYIPSNQPEMKIATLDIPASMVPKIASLPNVKAIMEYELPEPPDLERFWREYEELSEEEPSPLMWQVTLTQGAIEAWSLGFEGEGVKVAVLDTGVDFGHPDLNGTQARVENPASPYFGWPIAYDSRSMTTYLSTGEAFPTQDIWFSDTSFTDTDTDLNGFLDSTGVEVGTISSQSGTYHLGRHPDDYLRIRFGNYVRVVVVDTQVAGVYDTVYVDLDNDDSFADEKAAVRGDEVLTHDLDLDGLADRSGGLLYFIADGVKPIPYSEHTAQYMGVPNIIPTNGDLVTFMMNDATEGGGAHGTLCASAVAAQGVVSGGAVKGMAPEAKVISVGNIYQGGYWWDNYLFAVEGYDGVPGTGDEADILSLSFGSSWDIDRGWGWGARFVDDITTRYAPKATFMAGAGNGGYGYGNIIDPGASPGIITVGASTSWWTAEPANFTTWGDIISWSDRGPTALGQVDPDILSVGAYGSGDVTLNEVNNANSAWGIWGGTSMATPVAAGIMALIYESFEEANGAYPDSSVAREIMMSSADNIHYDALTQGAGIANASRAVRLANQQYGIQVSPSFWTAGGYMGTHYDAFANILYPGDSESFSFQVRNADQLNSTQVSISDAAHLHTKSLFYNIQSDRSVEDGYQWGRPDYLIPLIDRKSNVYEIPNGTDLVKASVYYDYFQFDPDWDYGIENRFYLVVYDWWDEDGDGLYWDDMNMDGVVQQSEIEGYPDFSEILRFGDSGQAANRYEVRVRDPYQRIHDGLIVGIFHTQNTVSVPVTSVKLRVDTYDLVNCDWLSVSPAALTVPPGSAATFDATASFPTDAGVGLYEAFLLLNYDLNETAIPVTASIASNSSDFLVNESSGELYDNGAVFGGFNWGWRYESGDWRYYFIDIQDNSFKQGQQIVANVSWEHVPTDIDVFLLGGVTDSFSIDYPDRYGPYSLEIKGGSEDTWAGGGTFLFQTATGGAQEIVAAPLQPGLWEVVMHNVLNAGLDSTENISVDIGTIEVSPNPWDIGLITDFSQLTGIQEFLTNSSINLPDIDVTAFGVTQPVHLSNQVVLQDDPGDASTASWSYEIDIQDGGLMDIFTDSLNPIDIDLYVLRDANTNGIPDWGSEVVAASTSPDETESVSMKKPVDGKYWIFIHGWSVGGPSSTFSIDIEAIYGQDIQLSDLPTGPVTAYLPENFNATYSLPMANGIYHGIIFAGPSQAPEVLSVRFYGEVLDFPPEFFNLIPAPDSVINNNQPIMGASFVDPGSGMNLSSVQMFVDGFNITSLATITTDSVFWATPFLLTEGLHTVTVSASDNLGNQNITSWSFTVDTIPPFLDVQSPRDGLITNNPLVEVSGVTEIDASLTVNGVPTLVVGNGSFMTFKALTEGQNLITVQARDLAGNSKSVDRTVILDTIPPPLSVTEPANGVWVNYPTVVVKGTSEKDATVSVGGQLAEVQLDGSFEVPVALFEGPNLVNLTATDIAGNGASTQLIVNVDTIPPLLFVDSPEDGMLTNRMSVTVSGTTEPSATLAVNEMPVTVQPDGSFSTSVIVIEGQNDVYVNATDTAGNMNGVKRTVFVDTLPPLLLVQKPENGMITNRPLVEVGGMTEHGANVVINGQLFDVNVSGYFAGTIAVPEGLVSIKVTAIDQAGNPNSETRTVRVDLTPPEANAGFDTIIPQGTRFTFFGLGSSDNHQISEYTWTFFDDSEVELNGSTPTYDFNNVGEYEVLLTVTDEAGNVGKDSVTVRVVPQNDADQDGLPDDWELEEFGNLGHDELDDPDMDFLNNFEEYTIGSDPNDPDTDGDGLKDGLDDDPLEPKGPDIGDYWWILIVIIVVLLLAMMYLLWRIRTPPPPPEEEAQEFKPLEKEQSAEEEPLPEDEPGI